MEFKKNNKGVTLIALVVTIVLIFIIYGIALIMLTGENSITKKAFQSKEATNEAEVKEKVELEVMGSYNTKGEYDKEKLKENLENNLGVEYNQIIDYNEYNEDKHKFEQPLDFPLYDYNVRVHSTGEVEIMPKDEIPTPPQLEEGDITFTADPATLTNKEVKVTIKANVKTMKLTLQYAIKDPNSDENWQTYTGPVIVHDNGSIFARLVNENGDISNYITYNVKNIDKQEPSITALKVIDETLTTNSVQVLVDATDDRQLASKDTYKFFEKEEGTEIYKLNGISTESIYTYTGLAEGKRYMLKVTVTDEAGNTSEKEIEESIRIPMEVPDLNVKDGTEHGPDESPDPDTSQKPEQTANLTVKYSNTEWNNDDIVYVTLVLAEGKLKEGLKLQYQTINEANTSWQDYSDSGFGITNNGTINVRLASLDEIQTSNTATSTYTKFDRNNPTVSLTVDQRTTTSIKVTATGSDGKGSGIKKYEFYEGANLKDTQETSAEEATYTYDSLTPGEGYNLKVVITDNVERTGEAIANADETKTIPDLNQEGAISFEYTPTQGNWTNEKVNVKATSKYTSDGYKIEYSTEEPESWQDYIAEDGFNVEEENGKFKVRLKQEVGELTTAAIEKEITWIDKTAPDLSITGEPQVSTNSITVNVTAEDSLSKLKTETPISYYLIEGEVTGAEQIQAQKGEAKESSTSTSYTYTNLTQGETYTVVVEAEDNAKNIATQSKVVTVGKVPGLDQSEDLTVNYSYTEWNNQENIHVTLTPKTPVAAAFKLQYKVTYTSPRPGTDNNVDWTDYLEAGFDITNNATINARITEKEGNQSGTTATSTYSKFDREIPEISEISITNTTTNKISVSVKATDKPDIGGSGLLDENAFTYVIDQTANVGQDPSETEVTATSDEQTHEFTNLTHGTNYTITVKVSDKAKNVATKTTTVDTTAMPSLTPTNPDLPQQGNITFNYEPSTWNNKEQATVTLQLSQELQETSYNLQYSLDNDEWKDYEPSGFTISENQAVYARLIDDNNQTGGVATSNYSFFDRKAPNLLLKADEKTQNEITLNVTATDTPSGLAEESPISYYVIEGRVADLETAQSKKGEAKESSENKTYTYTELKPGTVYTLLVEVTDKAGNKTAKMLTTSTESIPGTTTKPTTEGKDTDSDGKIDSWDTNGDGQIDAKDTTGDGNADTWLNDPTDTNSGWTNKKEQNPQPQDTNKDGLPDTWVDSKTGETVAEDTDNDGNADKFKDPATGEMKDAKDLDPMPQDTTGNGLPDTWVDKETGEIVAQDTKEEPDGKANQFVDENGELTDKDEEGKTLKDTDGDGVPDARVDEEGNVERKEDPKESDSPWVKDESGKDTDGDGIIDQYDPEKYPEGTKQTWDTDNDGEDNAADTDGDGKADQWKKEDGSWSDKNEDDQKQWDTNGDGIPDAKDTTGDDNADEWLTDPTSPESGWTDKSDEKLKPEDTNGDGLVDTWKDEEGNIVAKDTKEEPDGKANEFADPTTGKMPEEGAPETYPKPEDTNGDGLADTWKDEKGNVVAKDTKGEPDGKANEFADPATGKMPEEGETETYPKPEDTNGDGLPDTWKDEDGNIVAKDDKEEPDGNPNKFVDPTDPAGPNKEGSNLTDTDEEGNKYQDNDRDGIPDVKVDPDSGDIQEVIDPETGEWTNPEELPGKPKDTTEPKDGIPDVWDYDNDETPDAWDTNGDGKPDKWDTDYDGTPDAWDTDNDGIPDAFGPDNTGAATEWEFPAEEGSITFTDKPDTWVNTQVEVTMKSDYTAQGYTIEYSKDYDPLRRTGEWTANETATLDQNGTIYARLKKNDTEETGGVLSHKVTNIDKTDPTVSVNVTGANTNSATLNVTASDKNAGLDEKPYTYYLIDSEVTDKEQVKEQKGSAKEGPTAEASYKYTGLKQGQTYTLVVEVKDKAGNITTESATQEIGKIPGVDKEGDITFSYSKDTWNNDPSIHVTISTGEGVDTKNYDLQYQTPEEENKDWQNYTDAGFDITKNGSIFARLKEKDGDQGGDTATGTYSKFDREEPTLSEIEVTDTTTNSISVSVTATDKPEVGGSGLLEENAYTYIIDQTANVGQEPSETQVSESSNENTHTFTGLTQGTDYTIKVMVADKAQNIAEQEKTQTTEKIPDLSQEGAITFDITPPSWTNKEQATIKLNTTSPVDESKFKLQYQTPNEENTGWQDYDKEAGFTITKNGSIFARLIENEGEQTGTSATYNYNFFDRKLPEISIETEEPGIEDVKVNVTDSKDEESEPGKNDASGLLEENKYTYYIEEVGGSSGETPANISDETSFTYGSLLQGKQYKVRVEVKDNAGNIGTSTTETITAKTIPDLNEEDALEANYVPASWTNAESVEITLTSKYTEQGYKLQYSTDYKAETAGSATWQDYEADGFTITDNQKFAARLKLESKYGQAAQYGKVKELEVNWIDRVEPKLEITGEPEKTTNSITVNVTASDELSKLKESNPITYYLLDGSVTDPEQIKTQKAEAENKTSTSETSHKFTGLTQATTYTVVVDAEDKAGNIETQSKVVTTEKVPDLNYGTDITYTYAPPSWTNTPPVTVTLNPQNNIDEGFILQYGTSTTAEEPTVWNDYNSKPFEQSENCTIYTRLKETDGNQVGKSAQSEMKLIDTEEPTGTLKVSSYSTNSLSVEVENPGDTLSGLHATETYQYSLYEGSEAEESAKQTKPASTETTASFTGLTQDKEYTVKVVIKDNAGNTHEATANKTLEKVPDLAAGDITFDYDTKTWTNKESVKVTLTAKETVDLNTYKLQYQTPAETDSAWHDYPAGDTGFNITTNGSIYARLIEKEGTQTGGTATAQYSWFDRKAPTITVEAEEPKVSSVKLNVTSSEDTESLLNAKDASGLVEENKYTYYIEEADGTGEIAVQIGNEESYTYTGLLQNKQYNLRVTTSDKAGNVGTSEISTITTKTIPNLNETDAVKVTYNPESWTNAEGVKVTLTSKYTEQGYKIEYSTDYKIESAEEATWEEYTDEGFTIKENQKYALRLKLEEESTFPQYGAIKEEEITWIDRAEPKLEITGEPEKTTNSITVNVTASDELSQLKESNPITYYLLDGSVTDPEQIKTQKAEAEKQTATSETSHQFTGLTQATTYTVVVDAEDKAGNIATQSKVVTTEKVPDLNEVGAIEVIYDPDEENWTNEKVNVKVTSKYTDQNYTLQWRLSSESDEDYKDYTDAGFNIQENGKFKLRLKETTGNQVGKEIEKEITWIDREAPELTINKPISTSTNSINVDITARDSASDLLEETPIRYYLIEGTVAGLDDAIARKGEARESTTNTQYKFINLKQNEDYTVVVEAEDKAHNINTQYETVKTVKVPDLKEGDITFTYDTNTWTNKESVKVTLSAKDTVDLNTYKLQYQIVEEGEDWHDYPEGDTGFNITENGLIYARLIEKDGDQTGGTATSKYLWFDRKAPEPEITITEKTKTTMSVSATATEDESEELGDSGLHKTEPYKFMIYQGETAEGVEAKEVKAASTLTTAKFEGLTAGTQYTVRVEAKDNAENIGKADKTESTQDATQVGINFVYYDNEGLTQKTESVTGSIAEDGGNTQIQSPTVPAANVTINGKSIVAQPKGWATEAEAVGTQFENGAQIEASEEDAETQRTYYMIYSYKATVSVYNESGIMQEQNLELIIDSKGEKIANGGTKLNLPDGPKMPDEKEWTLEEWVDQTGATVNEDTTVPVTGDQYKPKFTRKVKVTRYVYDESSSETGKTLDDLEGTLTALGNDVTPAKVNLGTDDGIASEKYRAKQWAADEAVSSENVISLNTEVSVTEDTSYYMLYDYDLIATFKYNNNGDGETVKATTTMNYKSEKIPVAPKAPSADKEGWKFRGWSTEESYTSEKSTQELAPITTDTTYFASYEKDFTVTKHEYNSETPVKGKAYMDYKNEEKGQSVELAVTGARPAGWEYFGWALTGDLQAEKIIEPNGSTEKLTGDKDYYAQYQKEIVVSLDLNKGTGSISSPKGNVYTNYTNESVKGVELAIPEETPENAGYEFVEWEDKQTGTKYNPGQRYTFEQNITLTAVWKDVTNPIIGIEPDGNPEYQKEQEATITITDNMALDGNNLKYVWKQSSEKPNDEEFTEKLTLTTESISEKVKLVEKTGNDWCLWVMAQDTTGNKEYKGSSAFFIDNQDPSTDKPVATPALTSIKVEFKQTDGESDINGKTKYYGYKETLGSEDWTWEQDEADEHTFKDLKVGTSYQVKTKVDDNVGNHSESLPETVSTVSITAPEITFEPELGTWTKEPVKVTIKYPEVADTYNLTKQYVFDDKASATWNEYQGDGTVTISVNGTKIYARSLGENNEGAEIIAEKTATNIDTDPPSDGGLTYSLETEEVPGDDGETVTQYTMILTGKSTDTLSGIDAYKFDQIGNATEFDDDWQEVNPPNTTELEVSQEISETGTWYFYTKDQAGNIRTQEVLVDQFQGCFVAGTKVSTPHGMINIENLNEGDTVYAYNEQTGNLEEKEIKEIIVEQSGRLIDITTKDEQNVDSNVTSTPDHTFFVVGEGWRPANQLNIGDKIITQETGKISTVTKLKIIEKNPVNVYNLEVQDINNYFVGNGKILAHSSGASKNVMFRLLEFVTWFTDL